MPPGADAMINTDCNRVENVEALPGLSLLDWKFVPAAGNGRMFHSADIIAAAPMRRYPRESDCGVSRREAGLSVFD